jgi:purine-cytosine permease-like protein
MPVRHPTNERARLPLLGPWWPRIGPPWLGVLCWWALTIFLAGLSAYQLWASQSLLIAKILLIVLITMPGIFGFAVYRKHRGWHVPFLVFLFYLVLAAVTAK